MKHRRAASLCLLSALAAAAAGAGEGTPPNPFAEGVRPGERLDLLIERVRYEHERLLTLEADFTQLKESAMLIEPSEATGVFSYAAPDRVRWEYESPDPITLLVAGEQMTTWYRDLGQAEEVHVGRHTQKILDYLGAGSSMETLLQYFDARLVHVKASREPFRVELLPRFERVARRLQEMTIWIDSDLFLPVRLRYVEADGDVTDYRFRNLRVNAELPAGRFELELPGEVDVRRVDLDQRTALQ